MCRAGNNHLLQQKHQQEEDIISRVRQNRFTSKTEYDTEKPSQEISSQEMKTWKILYMTKQPERWANSCTDELKRMRLQQF